MALARLALRRGDWPEAEALLQRALDQGAGPDAWETLGDGLAAAGDDGRARIAYANALRMQRAHPDGSDRLQVRFDGLKAGRYGVMVLHDKDGNRRFDVGPLGIPKDDYGFSNNPVVFSRPGFERIAFELPATGMRISVRMK